jgi:hypothetical protein
VAETPIDRRRFTDREVREILKRAVENEPSGALPAGRGFSLAELKAIGKDVGIEPTRLEDAARALVQNPETGFSQLVGIPTVLRHDRTVDGELDSRHNATVFSVIRRVMGHHGEVSEVSGSLEWRTKGGSVERLVTVSSNGGRTTIECSANLRQAAIGAYVSGGGVATTIAFLGVTASVGGSTLSIPGLALSLGLLGTAYVGLRAILRKIGKTESAKLDRVVSELAEVVHRAEGDDPDRVDVTIHSD